ncbi:MAG TPA: hypothetical protein VFQ35_16950 [Polyangiaceae bacterium]|nr:hypothetical protein [Polyangiaceae bacterium]
MALLSSCSLVVDANRTQCSTNADCAAYANSVCVDSLCQPEPKWKCLGKPIQQPAATGKFQVDFLVRHLVTQMPLPGVSARTCRKLDVECAAQPGEQLVTDESGKVTVSVDAGFEGYVRFEGPSIAPGLYFFNPGVTSDLPQITISIGTIDVISLLALQAGARQSTDRGVALISVRNCVGGVAPGVTMASSVHDDVAVPFYSEQGLPSGSAVQTDDDSYGGLLNASPGTHTFTATLAATGQRIGQATVLIQAGALTFGSVVPDGN